METNVKCHKCGSKDLIITELWANHTIEFTQENGVITSSNTGEGNPYRLECRCMKCKHYWKLKKNWQISQVII